jgi:hypothetical protein
MNQPRESLLQQLDQSISLFAQIRTPDAVSVAAFDTLKQARALIARALTGENRISLQAEANVESPLAA